MNARGGRTLPAAAAVLAGAVAAAACSGGDRPRSSPGYVAPNASVDAASDAAPAAGDDGAAASDEGAALADSPAPTDAAGDSARPGDAATDGFTATAADGAIADATTGETGAPAPAGDASPAEAAAEASGPPGPPACDPLHAWRPIGRVVSVPQAGFARFGGVSNDELSIAWTTTAGEIDVADRPTRGDDFGAPAVVTASAAAGDRVALAPTGLTLFAVSASRAGFIAMSRASRGGAWAASTPLQFANVDVMASLESGGQFSEPVLGADGAFYYVFTATGAAPQLFESTWDPSQGAWSTGVALPNAELASAAGGVRRATGASIDGRTLFFYDGLRSVERGAWRDSPAAPFAEFVDMTSAADAGAGPTDAATDGATGTPDAGATTFPAAAPNERCDTLYYEGTDSGGTGVFIAQ